MVAADDKDHGIAYQRGGSTSDESLAPLCRFHHRVKTHGGWGFTRLDATTVLWRSPHGLALLRDHSGTPAVTGEWPTDPPDV